MIQTADEFVQLRMSEDPKEYLRPANERADDSTWIEAIDRFPAMRSWVAHDKTISESIIRHLYSVADDKVSFVLASKRRTPPDILTSSHPHYAEHARTGAGSRRCCEGSPHFDGCH